MIIPEPQVQISKDGCAKRWEFYAKRPGVIYLQIWRKKSSSGRYSLVAQTRYLARKTGKQTVDISRHIVMVKKGDVIGLYWSESGVIAFDKRRCDRPTLLYADDSSKYSHLEPGDEMPFKNLSSEQCMRYSIRVAVYHTKKKSGMYKYVMLYPFL